MDLLQRAKEEFDYTVSLRRHFHRYPEVGPQEQVLTMGVIERELDAVGIDHVRVPNGGIFAFIHGGKPGKTVLLRGDMDALPIQEDPCNLKQPRVVVSEHPGKMHACGHDGHIAMLLTEGKILQSMASELQGDVILMFEQGEEGHLNITHLCHYIQDANLHIDTCYSTHVCWDLDAGTLACTPGTSMSGNILFRLSLTGTSGHGARPDLAHSPIDCFVAIYEGIQALRMKHIPPDGCLVWSLGKVHAGQAHNVIPATLKAEGVTRYLNVAHGQTFWKEFRRLVEALAPLYHCQYDLNRKLTLEPTVNDLACHKVYCQGIEEALGKDVLVNWGPWMAAETFSYMTNMYPSVNTFTGIRNQDLGTGGNHHTAQFDLDEQGLLYGVVSAVSYVLAFQNNPPDTSDFVPIAPDMRTLVAQLKGG